MKEFIEKLIGMLEECTSIGDYGEIFISLDEVYEVVNQLAEEYNNDFCEWEADENFEWFIKSPHEGVGITKEEHNLYKFCPYCGKKIKVVK